MTQQALGQNLKAQKPRYAIYLAPKPQTALWQFGSMVLGFDAASGKDIAGFKLPSMDEGSWHEATARPRNYGFHATVKAPFHLHENFSEHDLIEALQLFARGEAKLPPLPLQLNVLDENGSGGFLALTPTGPYTALRVLEAATVQAMDAFRAPLTESEIAKRKPEALTGRQKTYLATYGYPFVLEEFRAHFTLSDRLSAASAVAAELAQILDERVKSPAIAVDELVLFKQSGSNARFQILNRAPLGYISL